MHQIEQALKRSNPAQTQSPDQANELRYLLNRSRELLGAENNSLQSEYAATQADEQDQRPSPHRTSTSLGTPPSQSGPRDEGARKKTDNDQLNLDDAENPLQLLARTSELLSSISAQASGVASGPYAKSTYRGLVTPNEHDDDLENFFGRFRPRLDVGDELDPIELGLISLVEAEALFA